jgi:hypothetical protein
VGPPVDQEPGDRKEGGPRQPSRLPGPAEKHTRRAAPTMQPEPAKESRSGERPRLGTGAGHTMGTCRMVQKSDASIGLVRYSKGSVK